MGLMLENHQSLVGSLSRHCWRPHSLVDFNMIFTDKFVENFWFDIGSAKQSIVRKYNLLGRAPWGSNKEWGADDISQCKWKWGQLWRVPWNDAFHWFFLHLVHKVNVKSAASHAAAPRIGILMPEVHHLSSVLIGMHSSPMHTICVMIYNGIWLKIIV